MEAVSASDATAKRRVKRERGEAPGWINGALVLGTAIFAAVALLGIWWNLRAPYVDPTPKPPGGIAVTPFGAGNDAPSAPASGVTVAPGNAQGEASAALARAQALAAVDAAASGAAADVAAASQPAPLTASAATAALTAAATAIPPASTGGNSQDDMMQLLSRRDTAGTAGASNPPRPVANADLPAHYDNNDIGPVAAEAQRQTTPAAVASSPSATTTVAAALAQCERYRWYEVIPKQRCIWAVCNGRWGKDGCPAGANPGDSR